MLPAEQAIAHIKEAIEKSYGKAGPVVIEQNRAAVDRALAHLHGCGSPKRLTADARAAADGCRRRSDFVQRVHRGVDGGKGDALHGQRLPGRWHLAARHGAVGEAQIWRSRSGVGPAICNPVQPVGALVCRRRHPRQSVTTADLAGAPQGFVSTPYRAPDLKGRAYTIQVAPEDCTAATSARSSVREGQEQPAATRRSTCSRSAPLRERERANYEFFLYLPSSIARRCRASTPRARNSFSRCSSTPAPVPAAAKRRTSSC